MSVATSPSPRDTDTLRLPMLHTVCMCRPDVALCGYDVSKRPLRDLTTPDCLVCAAMESAPCPRCDA